MNSAKSKSTKEIIIESNYSTHSMDNHPTACKSNLMSNKLDRIFIICLLSKIYTCYMKNLCISLSVNGCLNCRPLSEVTLLHKY